MRNGNTVKFLNSIFPHPQPRDRETFSLTGEQNSYEYVINVDFPTPTDAPPGILLYLDATLPTSRSFLRIVREMEQELDLPPLLMAGVGHPVAPFIQRTDDFVPRDNQDPRSDQFHHFLTEQLLPELKQRYTTSEELILAGHSFGGMYVLDAMYHPGTPFHKGLAISPSLWVGFRRFFRMARAHERKGNRLDGKLYMAAGSMERPSGVLGSMKAFAEEFNLHDRAELDYRQEVFPWRNHFGVVPLAFRSGLEFLLTDE